MGSLLPLLYRVTLSPGALTSTLSTTSLPVGAFDGTWKATSKTPIRLGETREVNTGSSPIVHADDYLAESQRVGAGVRKRTGNHRWSRRSQTSHVNPDRFTGSRRILQADEAAVGADDHGAPGPVAHHGFEDAGAGGHNRESDAGRSAGDIDGDGDGVADGRFAGDLEGELFHAAHVAHAVDGRGDVIHRDLVRSQGGGPGTEGGRIDRKSTRLNSSHLV